MTLPRARHHSRHLRRDSLSTATNSTFEPNLFIECPYNVNDEQSDFCLYLSRVKDHPILTYHRLQCEGQTVSMLFGTKTFPYPTGSRICRTWCPCE